MDRLRRLQSFWAWLPAFRAVAETERLPLASKALGLSPSALSRTIRLLESELGRPLFERKGRELRLNASGARLLTAVRDAMRLVDDGVSRLESTGLAGTLRVAAPGWLGRRVVAPELLALRDQHPAVSPSLLPPVADPLRSLLRGEVDLVLSEQAPRSEEISVIALPPLPARTYVARRARPVPEGVVVPLGAGGGRKVLLEAELEVALDLCLSGAARAQLPRAMGDKLELLKALPGAVPPLSLHALRRTPLGDPGLVGLLLDRITKRLETWAAP